MENDNHLPEMTEEKRKAALERSLAARRERMEFKDLVRKGELSLADALDDDRAKRIRVHEFLMCMLYWGITISMLINRNHPRSSSPIHELR